MDNRRNLLLTTLSPLTDMLSSALTMAILVVATRSGMFVDIAGYAAGTSISAIVAALAGGGTTLAYVTGDAETREAVRKVRYVFVIPIMAVASISAAIIYSFGTDLPVVAIITGGTAVLFNNLSELEAASLKRQLKTAYILVASLVARLTGLLYILMLDRAYSETMLVISIIYFALLRPLRRRIEGGSSSSTVSDGFRSSFQKAYRPSLISISLLNLIVTRIPFLVAPIILGASGAGVFAALLNSQQAAVTIFSSGLYTTMAVSSSSGRSIWIANFERYVLGFSVVVSLASIGATNFVFNLLGIGVEGMAGWWWVVLIAAIPLEIFNTRNQYRYMAMRNGARAAQLLGSSVLGMALVTAVAFALGDGLALSSSILVGQVAALIVWMIQSRRDR